MDSNSITEEFSIGQGLVSRWLSCFKVLLYDHLLLCRANPPRGMQWIYRKKRNDQEHHEKVSFFHLANFECFFLFVLFLENVLFNSHVVSLTHAGKRSNSRSQMFSKTGVLKNFAIFTGKNLCSVEKVFLKNSQNS